MDTTTIIAIIIGIITVITVVVVIVIQNKQPTPSPPTTDCKWMAGKWEIDNNTQMNIQDTNYPEECKDVTNNCGLWKRDVTCTSSNGVGNCTDNDCTGTKPVGYIDCGPCSKHPRQFKMKFLLNVLSNNYDLSSNCKLVKSTHSGNPYQLRNMAKELVDTVVTFSNKNGGGFDVKTLTGDNFFFQQENLPHVLGYKNNIWRVNENTDLFIRLYSDETYKNEITSTRDINKSKQYWFVFEDNNKNKYYPYLLLGDVSCRVYLSKTSNVIDNNVSENKLTIQLNDTDKPNPTPTDNIIKVGDKVKLLYLSDDKKWNEFNLGGANGSWVVDGGKGSSIEYLIVSVDGKQLGDPVTQQDKITLKFQLPNTVISVMSRWNYYLYMVDVINLDSSYITKFHIITKDTNGINDDVLRENTDYILQDAVAPGNFLDNNSENGKWMVFKLRDKSFDPRILKLQKV